MRKQIITLLQHIPVALIVLFVACRGNNPAINEIRKEHRILDSADLLTVYQEDSIFALIQDLEKNIGSQIAILTLQSLKGEKIEERSLQTARKMRLGRKDYDDGVLITVALYDRQMRIEVGYGLENIIRDDIASRINREEMAPKFREDDYFHGIKAAIEEIKKRIEENKQRVGERPEKSKSID